MIGRLVGALGRMIIQERENSQTFRSYDGVTESSEYGESEHHQPVIQASFACLDSMCGMGPGGYRQNENFGPKGCNMELLSNWARAPKKGAGPVKTRSCGLVLESARILRSLPGDTVAINWGALVIAAGRSLVMVADSS